MGKGELLKQIIKKSKFNQREIANQLGYKDSYVSLQLKKTAPSEEFIEKLCNLLNIDPLIISQSTDIDYQSKYEELREIHLNEKTQWLNKFESLMAEIHELKEKILALRGRE